MPFIHTRVNQPLDSDTEKRLSVGIGRAITLLPGKTEDWLMLQFEDNCHLYFKGDSRKALAIIQVGVLGHCGDAAYGQLTAALTQLLKDEMNVQPDGVYVQYLETEHWGWNGSNF